MRRSIPTLGITAAFLAGYPILTQLIGTSGANVFVLLPIIAAAWSFGLRGGLIAGLALVAGVGAFSWASGGLLLPSGAMERVLAVVAVGAVVGWLSDLRRNVTRSRAMYAALVENGPALIYVWSRQRGLHFISSNAETLTGYSTKEWKADAAGLLQRQLEPADRVTMATALEGLEQSGRPVRATFRLRRPDGATIWVDHHANLIERTVDDITIQGTVIDVTARHEVVEARELSKAALAESQAKSTFLAATSHELRTPLNSILGFAQLGQLAGLDLDPRTTRYLENIESSGRHLLSLINDLLDLARVNAGELDVNIQKVDGGAVVREAIAQMAPLASAGNVTLHEPSGQHLVAADPRRLYQIVLNLLSNAIKFTPPAGRVTVVIEQRDRMVLIKVIDTGIGISVADRSRIFNEFQQAADTDPKYEGIGLGLPLSRRLAQLMGGAVDVHSTPGTGSVFTLSLPAAGAGSSPA